MTTSGSASASGSQSASGSGSSGPAAGSTAGSRSFSAGSSGLAAESTAATVDRPVVSVVMATYNRSNIVGFAIESVLAQTLSAFELVVVGDACTDDTEEVVGSYDDERVRFVTMGRNFGEQSGPNNVGAMLARADLIAYLNHDDLYFPDHLEVGCRALEQTGADIVFTRMAIINRLAPGDPGASVEEGDQVEVVDRGVAGDPRIADRRPGSGGHEVASAPRTADRQGEKAVAADLGDLAVPGGSGGSGRAGLSGGPGHSGGAGVSGGAGPGPAGRATIGGVPWMVDVHGVARPRRWPLSSYQPASSWVCRREVLERLGGWRPASAIYSYSSQELLFRAHRAGFRIIGVPDLTVLALPSSFRDRAYADRHDIDNRLFATELAADPSRLRATLLQADQGSKSPEPDQCSSMAGCSRPRAASSSTAGSSCSSATQRSTPNASATA